MRLFVVIYFLWRCILNQRTMPKHTRSGRAVVEPTRYTPSDNDDLEDDYESCSSSADDTSSDRPRKIQKTSISRKSRVQKLIDQAIIRHGINSRQVKTLIRLLTYEDDDDDYSPGGSDEDESSSSESCDDNDDDNDVNEDEVENDDEDEDIIDSDIDDIEEDDSDDVY